MILRSRYGPHCHVLQYPAKPVQYAYVPGKISVIVLNVDMILAYKFSRVWNPTYITSYLPRPNMYSVHADANSISRQINLRIRQEQHYIIYYIQVCRYTIRYILHDATDNNVGHLYYNSTFTKTEYDCLKCEKKNRKTK